MDANDKPNKTHKKRSKAGSTKRLINWSWVLTITPLSFCISVLMSYLSNEALANVGNLIAFIILFLFIGIGILFDMIGVAATSATEKEFHSMAARKVTGAREAVWLSRNAEKVSSFCNDVVGDICGIISGATSAVIVARLILHMPDPAGVIVSLAVTGLVAATTIGGKACGKGIAIQHSVAIVFGTGRLLSVLPITPDKKK